MKLRKRLRENTGGATMVVGLAIIALALLLAGFIVDFSKNTQLKQDYTGAGQRATQAALVHQNGTGGLQGSGSANALINEYMLETRGKTLYNISTSTNAGSNPNQSLDTAGFRKLACAMSTTYPKITVYYDTGRHDADYVRAHAASFPHATSVGGQQIMSGTGPNQLDDGQFSQTKYRTIIADIVDVSDNYFFGIFSKDMACQEYHVDVSAMATNSDDFQNAGN